MAQATAQATSDTSEQATIDRMHEVFDAQRQAFLEQGAPSYQQRMADLDKLGRLVRRYQDDITEAIRQDFGSKSWHETVLAEIFTTLNNLKYTKKRLKKWMKPQRRQVDMTFLPGKAQVVYQPKGVVGIIAPWNYPFYLAAVPLTSALAAGNRVMIKPSEVTPHCSAVMKRIFEEAFPPEQVAVFEGGPEVGKAFSSLPWDHLFFTGSTALGKIIMKAAAEHLTPVTLELGGKSPLVLHRNYPVDKAVKRIVAGKYLNGGQTCVAPDYLYVPEEKVDNLVNTVRDQVSSAYPTLKGNHDYTSVVNERHYERLQGLLKDAREKGATVVEINPANEDLSDERKIPPTLVLNVNDDMKIMQEEIFGPLLPILSYKELDEALTYINEHPRPLALYYFDHDQERAEEVLAKTTSGGACINETVMHVGVDDLPFGGVGDSGMGAYHGLEGFETFSHKKGVLIKGRFNSANLLAPPYDSKIDKLLNFLVGK